MQLGRYDDAAAAYLHALELQPGLWQAHDNLALARQLLQQTEAAGTAPPDTDSSDPQQATSDSGQSGKTATLPLPDPDYQHGSLDSWLQQIPDNPAILLKRQFQRELAQPVP